VLCAYDIPQKKVMRKRSTFWKLAERTIHRLEDCPGRKRWKVAFEPGG